MVVFHVAQGSHWSATVMCFRFRIAEDGKTFYLVEYSSDIFFTYPVECMCRAAFRGNDRDNTFLLLQVPKRKRCLLEREESVVGILRHKNPSSRQEAFLHIFYT